MNLLPAPAALGHLSFETAPLSSPSVISSLTFYTESDIASQSTFGPRSKRLSDAQPRSATTRRRGGGYRVPTHRLLTRFLGAPLTSTFILVSKDGIVNGFEKPADHDLFPTENRTSKGRSPDGERRPRPGLPSWCTADHLLSLKQIGSFD